MNLKKFRSTFDRHVFYNAGFSEAIEHNENWVDNLPVVASWLVSQAMALEVVDEASFSESEKKLDTRSRRDFWIARYVASCEDSWCLLDNLSSLPEWLRDSNLSDLLLISKECSLDFESAIKKNLLHDELQSAIRKRLPSGIPGAFDVLYEKCTKATRYANLKNEQHCQASNATDAAIIRILESAHAPMTWNQIEKLLEPEIIVSTSYFRARLSSLAIKFGRNSYGLMTHCPLPLDELNQIKVVIEEFIAPQSVERQWHSQDFLEVCEVKGLFFSIQLDIYLVNMALLSSSMLQPLGRLVWARKDAQGLSEKRRVRLQRAMVLLLEKSGGPLSTEEMKRQIKEIRGVGNFFQVFPVGRIAQVGKGMWDLNDRNDAIESALT